MPRIVVEIFLELAFNNAALFFDNQQLVLALRKGKGAMMLKRPHHPDLIDIKTNLFRALSVNAKQPERFHQVKMALAGRHDAEFCMRIVKHGMVDRVRSGEGESRVLFRLHPFFDLRPRQIGPAIMQSPRWRFIVWLGEYAAGLQRDAHAGFNRFRDRLEPDPHARKTRQRIAVFPKAQDLGHVRRIEDGHEKAHEGDI